MVGDADVAIAAAMKLRDMQAGKTSRAAAAGVCTEHFMKIVEKTSVLRELHPRTVRCGARASNCEGGGWRQRDHHHVAFVDPPMLMILLAGTACPQLTARLAMLKGYNSLVYPLLPLLNLRHQSFGVNDARSRHRGVGARVGQLRRLLLSELKQLTWRKSLHDTATTTQSHGACVAHLPSPPPQHTHSLAKLCVPLLTHDAPSPRPRPQPLAASGAQPVGLAAHGAADRLRTDVRAAGTLGAQHCAAPSQTPVDGAVCWRGRAGRWWVVRRSDDHDV